MSRKNRCFPVINPVFFVKLFQCFFRFAVDAAIDAASLVHQLEFMGQFLLGGRNATGVGAEQTYMRNFQF